MSNQTVFVLVGLPASGKSTFAKQFVKENPNYKRLNKDDLRALFDDSVYSKDNEHFVLQARNLLLEKALKKGLNVIIDDTNLNPIHIEDVKLIVQKYANTTKRNVNLNILHFPISVGEAIDRDSKRIKPVGAKVITDMYNKWVFTMTAHMFDEVFVISPKEFVDRAESPNRTKALVVDVDGTLAIKSKDRGIFEWDKVDLDIPNKPVVELVKILQKKFYLIIVSGRDAVCMDKTGKWLVDNGIQWQSLFMRKEGDMRKDSIVKKEIYENSIREHFDVVAVLDDRNQTVDMFRHELGLPVLQVADGDF